MDLDPRVTPELALEGAFDLTSETLSKISWMHK